MEDGAKRVMREAGVDVERTPTRSKRQGLLTVQTPISSWTADDVEGWPIANNV